ncbi:hypothetical protein [Brachybacterium timonense]|uniref:hypothetical protein n=1 Tax=Brachybacterium timonense TaxID=2050896 RepID=UPI000D0AF16A|nr:hypothetical protein [Brachybacterium timonense]
MDHDAIDFPCRRPASAARKEIVAAYARFLRDGLAVFRDATVGAREYESNGDGHFAWDLSYVVRAAVLGWRTTGDDFFSGEALHWAQHLIQRTDVEQGIVDWRGRSGYRWSSGPRYTAGTVDLADVGGVPLRIQAAADSIEIELPTTGRARITAYRGGEAVWTSTEGSLDPSDEDYLPDLMASRSSVHAVLFRGLPGPISLEGLPAGVFKVRPQMAPHLVHTGAIALALVEAADLLEALPEGSRSANGHRAEELRGAAAAALDEHSGEIRHDSHGGAWYFTPEDFPGRRLGLDLPHNHVVDVASAQLLLGARERDRRRSDVGRSLLHGFVKELRAYEARDIPQAWYYYPRYGDAGIAHAREHPLAERRVRAALRPEDASHASVRARSLPLWHRLAPEIITESVLETAARSVVESFIRVTASGPSVGFSAGDDEPNARDGFVDSFVGAWAELSWWSPELARSVVEIAAKAPPQRVFGATLLAAAEIAAHLPDSCGDET